jgi:hypothetical protein
VTTVLDKVRAFVARLAPDAVCDDCIAARLDLTADERANPESRALAGTEGFVRAKGPCSLCGETRLVIARP